MKALILTIFVFSMNFASVLSQKHSFEYKNLKQTIHNPESITQISGNSNFVTFEKTYFGKLQLQLQADKRDTIIVILGEKSEGKNKVDIAPPGTIRCVFDTIILQKGSHNYITKIPVFEPPGWAKGKNYDIKLPDSIGNVTPFRYVEIRGYQGELEIKNLNQIAFHYPFNDNASLYKTSDENLNNIWELCKHSIKATTYTGLYIDGDRERRPYEGDAYINQLSHYVVDAEYAICRKTIDHLFQFPTWPTEWPLHMHLILWTDYLYTGDKAYLIKYYDQLKKIVTSAEVDDTGLIMNTKEYDIIDWPPEERDGYQIGMINNVPNAFYYNSLVLMSKIAGTLNKQVDSVFFTNKAEIVRLSFNAVFWDRQNALYVDAQDSTHSSLHANVFPIVFGLADNKQKEGITPFIKSKGMAASVYGAQYLLDALYILSEGDYVLELIRAKGERGWLNMIEKGSTITWEAWSEKVKPNLDWNHAWGTAPANVLSRRFFGIRPFTPGFEKALIQPQVSSIESGKIKHPTLQGDIIMSFTNNTNETRFLLNADVPTMMHFSNLEYYHNKVFVNNENVNVTIEGNQFYLDLKKGVHTIKLEKR